MVLRLTRGDRKVFALVYERFHHALYLNVIRLVHTPAAAEDIVQEVFLTLWKKRQSIDPDRPLDSWLFTVSYHLSIDWLKEKLRRQACIGMVQSIEATQTAEGSPEFQLNLLEEAIERLPPQKKKVFQLCKLEGKSYEQASAELGISKYTINEYLKDGMNFIRQYVKAKVSFDNFLILFLFGAVFYALLSYY